MDKTADENFNHEEQDSTDWSEEEVKEVISKVIHATGSKNFNYEVKKLNWNTLKVEGREPETCKSMFLKLTHNLRKHRTVTEILNDVTESLTKSVVKVNTNFSKPLTGYFMFVQDKDRKLKEKHPDMSRKDRLSKLLKRWNKSEALRSRYQEKYKVLYDEYKSKVEKLDPLKPKVQEKKGAPKLPTPFLIFCSKKRAHELEQNPEMDWKQTTALLKSKYNNLSAKKKFHFMNKALKQMSEYKKELETYKQNHPDFQAKSDELPLTKEEKSILNDKFPRPPPLPINTYQYYCSKERPKLSGVNVADHSRQLAASYKMLKEGTKLEYEAEFKKCLEEHIEKLLKYRDVIAPWSDKTAQEVTTQLEKYQRALVPKKKKKRKSRAKEADKNGTITSDTDKAHRSQKRKAKETSEDEESSDEVQRTPAKRKKISVEGGISKSLFGFSSLKSGAKSSSESEKSDSDESNEMPSSFRMSPLKTPKKES